MISFRLFAASVLAGLTALSSNSASVTLPDIFSDHMVCQKSPRVPIWGTAAPGEDVVVQLAGQSAQAKTDAHGKWEALLNLEQCGPGSYQMLVKGANELAVNDVVIGEVWLASGQSNMATILSATADAQKEIAVSTNPLLREFIVEPAPSATVSDTCKGKWVVASSETSAHFSAISYYFGKELQKELQAPVGLIHSSYGGTFLESWLSPGALAADPSLAAVQKVASEEFVKYPAELKSYAEKITTWEQQHGRNDQPKGSPDDFAAPAVSTADWKTVKLPAVFQDLGLPSAGVTWLRKEIAVPASVVGHPLRLDMGGIQSFVTVYWNGVKVAETTPATPPGNEGKFSYTIPAAEVKAGQTVLAVRVYSPMGNASLSASASGSNFRVILGGWVVFLAGDWLAKTEYQLPPVESAALSDMPKEPNIPQQEKNIPGYLYNGMIQPLIPYALRGIIWYQGESNTDFAMQYRKIFPVLIKDWRAQWKQPDLPFYFCQLASFGPRDTKPSASRWAELREAQTMATALPKTGEAILIDIGEEKDIHPRNKKEAGERLAKVALANTYGKKIPFAGPTFQSMKVEGEKIRLQFANSEGGLVARPLPATYQPRSIETVTVPLLRNSPQGDLEGFAICGGDHQWKWADAKIEGDQVIVWSPQVSSPVAVRYAWSDNPIVNLYNQAGLPAVPFRTDSLPGVTGVRTR